MELPSLKELGKIIKFCRKAGIKVFELGELRLTLTETAPVTKSRRFTPGLPKGFIQGDFVPGDMPTDEELLFASAGGPPNLEGFEQ